MTIRTAEYLIDNKVPYSEMTEEEINSVIEWRSTQKAKSDEIKRQQREFEKTQQEILTRSEVEASKARTDFEDIIGKVAARALAVEEVMKQYE